MSNRLMLEAIGSDFSVDLLSQSQNSTLYGALRQGGTARTKTPAGTGETHVMGVWHFVLLTSKPQYNHIRQWHIPQYKMAVELERLTSAAKLHTNIPRPITSQLDVDFALAMFDAEKLGFVVSDFLYPEIKPAFHTKLRRDLRLLHEGRKKVFEKDGEFIIPDATTPVGHSIQSPSLSLVEAIAFEQFSVNHLDPGNFGIYSAFCTYRDFETSKKMPVSLITELIEDQFQFEVDEADKEVLAYFMETQKKLLGAPIWGKGIKMSVKDAGKILDAGMKSLTRHQRVQFILLNGMHDAGLLLPLSTVTGVIDFRRYVELKCQGYQPDAPQEQELRKEVAFIKLYRELAEH